MSLTSRRPRPLDHTVKHFRDTSLFIIATEGEYTEKQYFQIFVNKSRNSRIQIKVLETHDGKSSPRSVMARLKHYKKTVEIGRNDQLWLVIDTDRWPSKQLAEVGGHSQKNNFQLAVSRPCFEAWLYLHHADPTDEIKRMSCREVGNELRRLLGGYNKSNIQKDQFEPYIDYAIRRAEALDAPYIGRWPSQFGTRVYLLVKAIGRFINN